MDSDIEQVGHTQCWGLNGNKKLCCAALMTPSDVHPLLYHIICMGQNGGFGNLISSVVHRIWLTVVYR